MARPSSSRRVWIPLAAGLFGSFLLAGVYLGIVSLAESPAHALDLFWQDRLFVAPILVGFGVQAGLFARLKLATGVRTVTGGVTSVAGGGLSTAAMAACCAHHVTDVLPLLGLSAAAAFLAEWKTPFLIVGLLTNLAGIALMARELRRVTQHGAARPTQVEATA
ncbi:MAG TPA: hypothetical protein VLD63_09510 [Anaerolineales bacterium]|nr:hypothetical protein [Anaerolineales bacterium]